MPYKPKGEGSSKRRSIRARTKAHRRTLEAADKRARESFSRNNARHPENTTITLKARPLEYLRVAISGKAVDAVTAVHFSHIDTKAPDLPYAPFEGIHVVKLTAEEQASLPPDYPEVTAIRGDKCIPEHAQKALLDAWDELKAIPTVKWHHAGADNRSSTSALHTGVWSLSKKRPSTTLDTRQTCPITRKAVDKFNSLVQQYIAPIIERLLFHHSPNLLPKLKRAREYVDARIVDKTKQYQYCNFGSSFFTVAMKEGSSEKFHIDFNDHAHSLTWVVPIGDWQGGHFLAPQLGEVIPVGAGQVLGSMTRQLVHCGTPITSGRRLVLTLFTDNTLINRSETYHQNKEKRLAREALRNAA